MLKPNNGASAGTPLRPLINQTKHPLPTSYLSPIRHANPPSRTAKAETVGPFTRHRVSPPPPARPPTLGTPPLIATLPLRVLRRVRTNDPTLIAALVAVTPRNAANPLIKGEDDKKSPLTDRQIYRSKRDI